MIVPAVPLQPGRSSLFDAPTPGFVVGDPGAQTREVGDAATRAGMALVGVSEVLQQRYDESRVREADAKLSDIDRELLSGPQGYLNQAGRAALDARADTLARLDENRRTISQALSSPAQREMFARVSEARRQRALLAIDTHYADQLRVDDIAETTARANALLRDAADSYFLPHLAQQGPDVQGPPTQDPYKVTSGAFTAEVRALAQKKGLGPEATAEVVRKAVDQLHENVATQLVDRGEYHEALAFLNGSGLEGTKRSALEARAQSGIAKLEGERVAQTVALNTADLTHDLTASLNALDQRFREGLPAPIYDEARKRVLAYFQDRRTADAQFREDTWRRTEEFLQTHGHQPIFPEQLDSDIVRAGLGDRVDAYVTQGRQFVTDQLGLTMLGSTTTGELRAHYASVEELRDAMRPHTSLEDLGKLVKRWQEGDADLPKRDSDLILADRLRDLLKLGPDAEIGPKGPISTDLFRRWKDRVAVHARAVMDEKVDATIEQATAIGAERAAREGWWLDARRSRFVPEIAATPGQVAGAVVQLDRAGTMAEARLDLVNPDTQTTFRETVQDELRQQAERSEPGKPRGYVRIAERPDSPKPGPQIVPLQTVTLSDIARTSALLVRQYETAGRLPRHESAPEAGLSVPAARWLRDAFLSAVLSPGGVRKTVDDVVREMAARPELRSLGLTEATVRAYVEAHK